MTIFVLHCLYLPDRLLPRSPPRSPIHGLPPQCSLEIPMRRRTSNASRTDRQSRTTRRTLALRVESLEGRTLLSTFTVTNTKDYGPGSLREVILSANSHLGADTIAFN